MVLKDRKIPLGRLLQANPLPSSSSVIASTFHDVSSAWDDIESLMDDDEEEPLTATTTTTKQTKPQQLHRADKVLATRTQFVRSQAFDLLHKHRVYRISQAKEVEGDDDDSSSSKIVISGPGVKIPMNTELYLDGKRIPPLPPDLFVFHKPKGVLSAMKSSSINTPSQDQDPTNFKNRDHLGNHLPPQLKKVGMHPVGRLDYDTSGLMLFSKDGQVTHKLLHPNFEVEREYIATMIPQHVEEENSSSSSKSNIIPLDLLQDQIEKQGIPILLRDCKDPSIKTSFVCFGQVLDISTHPHHHDESVQPQRNTYTINCQGR